MFSEITSQISLSAENISRETHRIPKSACAYLLEKERLAFQTLKHIKENYDVKPPRERGHDIFDCGDFLTSVNTDEFAWRIIQLHKTIHEARQINKYIPKEAIGKTGVEYIRNIVDSSTHAQMIIDRCEKDMLIAIKDYLLGLEEKGGFIYPSI